MPSVGRVTPVKVTGERVTYLGHDARGYFTMVGYDKKNPSKRAKLGKWITAHRVRVVKNPAGDRVIEVQRTVKKTVRRKRR